MPQTAVSRPGDARRRIADEHRQLSQLLDQIEDMSAPSGLAAALERLRGLLVAHFEGEEADDGLHEAIGRSTPHLLPAVQHLFDEHREFLSDLDALTERARELAAGPVEELRIRVTGLASRLRAHEAEENELFGDSVYTDIGSQD